MRPLILSIEEAEAPQASNSFDGCILIYCAAQSVIDPDQTALLTIFNFA
jgi:hypothetical protein